MSNWVVVVVILLKFGLPVLFWWWPFQASWVNWVLDTVDGDILMHFGLNPVSYQMVDKLADWVTYGMMFLVGRKWKIGRTITVLFGLRTVGQILFFITRNDRLFFVFPNFLEPLFMGYSLLLFADRKKAYGRYRKYWWPMWAGIVAYKMWNEWNTHVAKIDLSSVWLGINN
jgi:hypothetical protein